jgi:hypothetical protein
MSITLRNTSDTATSQTYDYASKTTPLTSTEVDKNFITLKQKCDELATDYTTTFNADGSLKDGAVTSVSITDNSVTATKIKDRSVDWAEQRNIIYLTDTSTTKNKVEGTINDYQANSSLTTLPAGTVIYFKPATENTAGVTLTVKDLNTTTDDTSTLLSLDLTKQKDVALGSADMKAGGVYAAFYDGTTLQLVNTLQDPTVEVKESISRVQTFGPIEWEVASLKVDGDRYDGKESGLTEHPTSITALLRCEINDGDYIVGDLVPLELATDANRDHGFTVRAQATEIKVARSQDNLKLPEPSTGGVQALAIDNWTVVVRGTFQNDSTYSPAYVDRALSYPAAFPTGGVTVGNYLYIFSSQNSENESQNPVYKINLITNRVIYLDTTFGYQNPSIMQYSTNINTLHASSVSVGAAGTGYKVGDIITLPVPSTDPGAGTHSSVAKFVVKTITGGLATGPVGTMYDITDAAGAGQSSGTYTVAPDSPVATTATAADGTTSAGADLTLVVNWSSISTSRIYWTTRKSKLHYIEPNNSDNAETVNKVSAEGAFNGTAKWVFNVQAIVNGEYYGFDLGDSPTTLGGVHLYNVEGGSQNSTAINLFSDDRVKQLEGGRDKPLECLQWNPIKKRLYASCRWSNLMHIFTWGDGNLLSLATGGSAPEYQKTIGIPSPGWATHGSLDMVHVDWDTDTGEEKSITISKYGANGTVTRAAWKED